MQQRTVASGQTHHGLVNGGVAMGIQLHGLPHNVGRLCARAREQSHFVHGVQQLPVRGLKSVDLRNGAGDDHAHGVGHIVQLQRVADGLLHHLGVQPLHIGILNLFYRFFRFFLLSHISLNYFVPIPGRARMIFKKPVLSLSSSQPQSREIRHRRNARQRSQSRPEHTR